jgi:cellulose synthase/poly-beta-1,6-N-acetylglucosamine synthase-like glycosyltransferase
MQPVVIADHCTDNTAVVAVANGALCLSRSEGQGGKGAALAWAIERLKAEQMAYDAAVIIDADTLADPAVFRAFDERLQQGHTIQQGYNYLSNPWESPFTRIIAVTSILKNGLFYAGKSRLGLSAMLTGTGMCLHRAVLERYGWTAFSVGEDWEFSVSLLLAGEDILFNADARVFAKESHGMKEASHQRLRWASGRHAVGSNTASQLIVKGVQQGRWRLIEAAVTLLAPNYSTQASLALLTCVAAWIFSGGEWTGLLTWAVALLASLAGYFLLGVALTDSPWKTLAGLPLIPVFLPWRLAIEILGLLGYGRGSWGRSARASVGVREEA